MNTSMTPANVVVYGFDRALSSAITGVVDLFAQAGVTWQAIHGQSVEPVFSVQLLSAGGSDIRCANGITLKADGALTAHTKPDLLLIPSIGSQIDQVLATERSLYPLLRHFHTAQVDIAANCTGVFLLAQAGLLDQKAATTHWGFASTFEQKYPGVDLQSEKLHTCQENIFCAGGGMAWFDLALLLIERYAGAQVARQTAKAHVLDLPRYNQSLYAGSRRQIMHQDSLVREIQNHMARQLAGLISLERVASHFNVTPRTLTRRFKAATGMSPGRYLQQLRIDHARKLLETSRCTLDSLLPQIGYEDASSFSRLFKRHTGYSVSQYRAKFSRDENL
ncbi:GlxA family transcriptional regulator [Salinimonas marina]|nr:helix-turn-helix domain-containing protein [Salinimonas marina]